MTVSNRAKGNYYLNKTKKYYEALGYDVVKMETLKMAYIRGRVIPIKTDLWASDLLMKNKTEMIFVQIKTHPTDMSKAVKAYKELAPWPPAIKLLVLRWPLRAREPIIRIVQ